MLLDTYWIMPDKEKGVSSFLLPKREAENNSLLKSSYALFRLFIEFVRSVKGWFPLGL